MGGCNFSCEILKHLTRKWQIEIPLLCLFGRASPGVHSEKECVGIDVVGEALLLGKSKDPAVGEPTLTYLFYYNTAQ